MIPTDSLTNALKTQAPPKFVIGEHQWWQALKEEDQLPKP
jgi:hypothetical protein